MLLMFRADCYNVPHAMRIWFWVSWLWHVLSSACILTFEYCMIQARILISTLYNMICIVTYIITCEGSKLTWWLCYVSHVIHLPPSKVMLLYLKVWASTFRGFNPYYCFDSCHRLWSRSTCCNGWSAIITLVLESVHHIQWLVHNQRRGFMIG